MSCARDFIVPAVSSMLHFCVLMLIFTFDSSICEGSVMILVAMLFLIVESLKLAARQNARDLRLVRI